MSIEAVTSRIQQIMAMQQELATGTVAGGASSSTTAAGTTTPAATTGASTSFSDALATAQGTTTAGTTTGLGPTGTTGTTGSTAGLTTGNPATGATDPRIQSMVAMANSLLGKPYVWGGGHAGFVPNETSLSGFDCSGFVSAVLHAGGYLSAPQTTDTMPGQPGLVSGPGQYVTIYDRTGSDGHVIIDINGQFYESGGGSGSRTGGVEGGLSGGVAAIGRPSDSYLATFDTILHPEGL